MTGSGVHLEHLGRPLLEVEDPAGLGHGVSAVTSR